MIFGGLGCVTSNSWLDFAGDPDRNADTGILKEFLSLQDRAVKEFLLITQKVIVDPFIWMWDISLATSRFLWWYGSRYGSRNFLTEFLSLLDRVNNYCKNFTGSVALATGLRSPSASSFVSPSSQIVLLCRPSMNDKIPYVIKLRWINSPPCGGLSCRKLLTFIDCGVLMRIKQQL